MLLKKIKSGFISSFTAKKIRLMNIISREIFTPKLKIK